MGKAIVWIWCLVFIVSCRKDEPVVPVEEATPCPVVGHIDSSYSEITVGNNAVVYGAEYIRTEVSGTMTKYYIDLLNDCTEEIRLFVDLTNNNRSINLSYNNSIRVYQNYTSWTSFTYQADQQYYDFTGGVEYYSTIYKSNFPQTGSPITTTAYHKWVPHYVGSGMIIHESQITKADSGVNLWQDGTSAWAQKGSYNDTLCFESVHYNWNYLPQNENERYVVFSYNSSLGMKFGWIKLEFTNPEDIHLVEYALQP